MTQIDLTGRGGLSPKFYGDVTGEDKPNLRYIANEGQVVKGIYNPFRVFGYLSPANESTVTVTPTEVAMIFGSSLYDPVSGNGYLAERGSKIFFTTDLNNITLDNIIEVKENEVDIEITDIELNQVGGARALYYAYKDGDSGDIGVYIIDDKYSYDIEESTSTFTTGTYATQEIDRFAQKVYSESGGFLEAVKLWLRFDGTDNSFNLQVRIAGSDSTGDAPSTTSIVESATVAASTLSTTALTEVTFELTEATDLSEYSTFWIVLEPTIDTLTFPANDYTIGVASDDDKYEYYSDGESFLFLGYGATTSDWMSTATDEEITHATISLDDEVSNNNLIGTITTGDGNPTVGDIVITFDVSVGTATGWGAAVQVDGSTVSESNGWDFTADPVYNSGNSWTGTTSGSYSLTIHDSVDNGAEVVFSLYADFGTASFQNIKIAYTDVTTAEVMAGRLKEYQQRDTWLSELIESPFNTSGEEVKFVPANSGLMYVLDKNAIHTIDGSVTADTVGEIYPNIILFPPYFNLIDGVDWRSNILIAVNHFSETQDNLSVANCGVYAWDGKSSTSNMADYIPINGAKEIRRIFISPNGRVRVMTISSSGITEIRDYTGNEFEVIKEVGFNATPKYKNSLQTVGNFVYWLAENGKFYAYGAFEPGEKEGLFILNEISSLTEAGAILYGGGEDITGSGNGCFYLGYKDTDTIVGQGEVVKYYPLGSGTLHGVEQKSLSNIIYYPVINLSVLSYLKGINISGAPAEDSLSGEVIATIYFYINGSETAWLTKDVTDSEWAIGYLQYDLNKRFVHSFQMAIEYSNRTLDGNDFKPMLAELDHEPENTKR